MDFQIVSVIAIVLARLYASIEHDHFQPFLYQAYNQHNTQCLLLLKNLKLVIFGQRLHLVNHR